MNSQEKIAQIIAIIAAQENDLCPYCFQPFETFRTGDAVQEACYNHEEATYVLTLDDYYNCIVSLIKFGEPKSNKTQYKNITGF